MWKAKYLSFAFALLALTAFITPVAAQSLDGKASYYADYFTGRKTASGEPYDPSSLTAAHKTLPFGTIVRVTNLRSGASVLVRINDRGPFVAGRVIDLSKAAAKEIDMIAAGVASVSIEIVPMIKEPLDATGPSSVMTASVNPELPFEPTFKVATTSGTGAGARQD